MALAARRPRSGARHTASSSTSPPSGATSSRWTRTSRSADSSGRPGFRFATPRWSGGVNGRHTRGTGLRSSPPRESRWNADRRAGVW